MTNAPGIWEMTWSFAGPDGRATFEWIRIAGEPGIRWRRIGGHAIFGQPWPARLSSAGIMDIDHLTD